MIKYKNTILDLLASGFKSGYAPMASGTFGTLVAIPFVILLKQFVPEYIYIIITIIIIALSIPISTWAEKNYGQKDSSKIVIDEIAGYFTSCILIPLNMWDFYVAAFFIFRFFDIVKVWPANCLDKKEGGFYVVMDDIVAGIYTCIALQIYFYMRVIFIISVTTGS